MIEKVLNEQSVFSGRVIKLSVLDVELQDGSESKRELVKHPGAVAVLPIDAEGNVLLVRQFRIAAGRVLTEVPAGTRVIDAAGCLVFPGVVDPHTHIQLDTGIYQTPDDWEIGTRTAAFGGVTTAIDFATQFPGMTFEQALEARLVQVVRAGQHVLQRLDLLAHEGLHPVELLLVVGIGLESPGHRVLRSVGFGLLRRVEGRRKRGGQRIRPPSTGMVWP